MFEGNTFLPVTGTPLRKIACMTRLLADADPVPFAVAILNAKSVVRSRFIERLVCFSQCAWGPTPKRVTRFVPPIPLTRSLPGAPYPAPFACLARCAHSQCCCEHLRLDRGERYDG